MGIAAPPPVVIPITEPVYVPDTCATELVAITENAIGVCMTFAMSREAVGEVPSERVIVCRLVLPRAVYESIFGARPPAKPLEETVVAH